MEVGLYFYTLLIQFIMRAKEAREIHIDEYLSLAGINPAKQAKGGKELWYSSPIRHGDLHPSFKVDTTKNLWFDFGIAKGGNVIDLVCELQNTTVKEALAILERTGLYSGSHRTNSPTLNQASTIFKKEPEIKKIAGEKEKSCVFDVLKVSSINNDSLINLLRERKINLNIAKKYLKQVKYKPKDKTNFYNALAWECGNGYEARSKLFKGFIGTHKDIIIVNLKDNQSVSIFEGYMDFLSFLTYYGITDFQNSVIILNSINLRKRALEEIEKYNFNKVYLFLDNDEGGRSTKDFFRLYLEDIPIVDKSSLYNKYNDFNEMVIEESKKWVN